MDYNVIMKYYIVATEARTRFSTETEARFETNTGAGTVVWSEVGLGSK